MIKFTQINLIHHFLHLINFLREILYLFWLTIFIMFTFKCPKKLIKLIKFLLKL